MNKYNPYEAAAKDALDARRFASLREYFEVDLRIPPRFLNYINRIAEAERKGKAA